MFSFFYTPSHDEKWRAISENPAQYFTAANIYKLNDDVGAYIERNKDTPPTSYEFVNGILSYLGVTTNQPYAVQVANIVDPIAKKIAKDASAYEVSYSSGDIVRVIFPMLEDLLKCYRDNLKNKSRRIAGYIDEIFEKLLGISAREITDEQFKEKKDFMFTRHGLLIIDTSDYEKKVAI